METPIVGVLPRTTRRGAANMSNTIGIDETATERGMGRRGAFGQIGVGAASAVAIGALAAGGLTTVTTPAQAQTVADSDILNFALNLEYLEAEYYLRAFTGQGLGSADITGLGTQGAVTGGSQVPFKSAAIQAYAQRLTSTNRLMSASSVLPSAVPPLPSRGSISPRRSQTWRSPQD